jgi:hypothetical protein
MAVSLTTEEERAEHRTIAARLDQLDGAVYRKQALTAEERVERASLERRRNSLIRCVRERRKGCAGDAGVDRCSA